jgi:hypothetical protein
MPTLKFDNNSTVKFDNTSRVTYRTPFGTAWAGTGAGFFSQSVNYVSDTSSCPSGELSWLTTNYPPSNYPLGFIMRVSTFTNEPAFCGNLFYIVV